MEFEESKRVEAKLDLFDLSAGVYLVELDLDGINFIEGCLSNNKFTIKKAGFNLAFLFLRRLRK